MTRLGLILTALQLLTVTTHAQDSASLATRNVQPKPAWITHGDIGRAGAAAAGIALISLSDEGVARLMQRPSLHHSAALQHSANFIQAAGDPGALITSLSLYAVGSFAHQPGLGDASKHSSEAIAISGIITQALKLSIGRARPNVSHDENAYAFHTLHGHQTDYNSFPSGHTTAAFAAATVFSAEIGRTHPDASRISTPLLYGVSALVGTARIYNDRHWLSDVAAGALIGHFVGKRTTSHAHAAQ